VAKLMRKLSSNMLCSLVDTHRQREDRDTQTDRDDREEDSIADLLQYGYLQ